MNSSWPDTSLYPFASRYLTLPAGRMHYVDEGEGHPVVMVHGNPSWSFQFRRLIDALPAGYRCIAPDHLGFGLSDKPRRPLEPSQHTDNLAALIDALELDSVTLVLQDWGGPIGLSWAVSQPARVRALVLSNTWAWPLRGYPLLAAFSLLVGGPPGRLLLASPGLFSCVLLTLARHDRSMPAHAIRRHYSRPLSDPAARRAVRLLARHLRASASRFQALENALTGLQGLPVLLAWGMGDPAFRPKMLARWQRHFPEARTLSLTSAGHFVAEEAPEFLADALDALHAPR